MNDFAFNPTASTYDATNAHALSVAARLAYADEDEIASAVRSWGFATFRFFDNEGTQGYLAASDEMLLLVFRGTEFDEIEDLVADVKVRLVDGPAGQVHRGDLGALEKIWGEVSRRLHEHLGEKPSRAVWVTGHSLGAALATLATAKLALEEKVVIQGLYTFGSPRVGDRVFAQALEAACDGRIFRFVNHNDVVTRVPLPGKLLPYKHVGNVKYIDSKGRLRHSIRWWIKLLDRLRGRVKDLGKKGTDGMKDHGSKHYAGHLARIAMERGGGGG